MAIIKRESGAWKTVTNKLKQAGIRINTEGELLQLLDTEKIKHAESVRMFEQKKQEADQRCKDEIAQIFAEQENSSSSIRKEFGKKIRPIQGRIDALKKQQDEVNEKGFFYKLFHFLERINLSRELKNVNFEMEKITSERNDKIKEGDNFFARKQSDLTHRCYNVIRSLEKERSDSGRRITVLKDTLESKDYCGAVAELKMIDFLRKLPDSYYVINDVLIKPNRKSHQIDHVVVGPSGIFIIEVKNWSSRFISEGEFSDPYEHGQEK